MLRGIQDRVQAARTQYTAYYGNLEDMIITLAQSVEALQFALDIDGVPTSFDEKEQEKMDSIDAANGEGGDNGSSGPGSPNRKSRRVSRAAASSFYQLTQMENKMKDLENDINFIKAQNQFLMKNAAGGGGGGGLFDYGGMNGDINVNQYIMGGGEGGEGGGQGSLTLDTVTEDENGNPINGGENGEGGDVNTSSQTSPSHFPKSPKKATELSVMQLTNELRKLTLSVKELLMNKEMQGIETNYLKNQIDTLKQSISDVAGKYKQFDDEFEELHRDLGRISREYTGTPNSGVGGGDNNGDNRDHTNIDRGNHVLKAIEDQMCKILEFKGKDIETVAEMSDLLEENHMLLRQYLDAVEGGNNSNHDSTTQILHNLAYNINQLFKYNNRQNCPMKLSTLYCDEESDKNIFKYLTDCKNILSTILKDRCDIWNIVVELKGLTLGYGELTQQFNTLNDTVTKHIIDANTRNKQSDTTLQNLATLVKKASAIASGMSDEVNELKKKKLEKKDLQYLDTVIVEMTKTMEQQKIELLKKAKADEVHDEFDKIYDEISYVKNSIESVNEVSNRLDQTNEEVDTKLNKEEVVNLIHQIVPKPKSYEIVDDNILVSKYRCISCNRPIPIPLKDQEQLENLYTSNSMGPNDNDLLQLRDNMQNPYITRQRSPNSKSLSNLGDEEWDKDVSQGKPSIKNNTRVISQFPRLIPSMPQKVNNHSFSSPSLPKF